MLLSFFIFVLFGVYFMHTFYKLCVKFISSTIVTSKPVRNYSSFDNSPKTQIKEFKN